MKSLNSKTDISIFINLRYLRLKLLKNKENNKKICHIFHHNFKSIRCYVMSEVSLKRFYFALFDDGLTLKTLKLAFINFLIQTLHIYLQLFFLFYSFLLYVLCHIREGLELYMYMHKLTISLHVFNKLELIPTNSKCLVLKVR